jgi:hypothetical protein
MNRRHLFYGCASLLTAAALAATASAQNLVQNPSFEADAPNGPYVGLFSPVSGWTTVGGSIGEVSSTLPGYVGYKFLAMGTAGSFGHISQVLNTTPGQQYVFGFNFSGGSGSEVFSASWTNSNSPGNSIVVLNSANTSYDPNWDKNSPLDNGRPNGYTFVETATSTQTTIDFAVKTDGSFVALDSVFVAEPIDSPSLPNSIWTAPGSLSSDSPLVLTGGAINEITGDIGGSVLGSFYQFHWNGGAFGTTAYLAGNDIDPSSTFYFKLLGSGVDQVAALDQGDGFFGALNVSDLPAGDYTIGLSGDGADPVYYINFGTPVQGVPEPTTWAMVLMGFIGVGGILRRQRPALLVA